MGKTSRKEVSFTILVQLPAKARHEAHTTRPFVSLLTWKWGLQQASYPGYNPGDSVIFWNLKCIISVTNPLRSGTGLWFQQLLGTGCQERRGCWLLLCSYHSWTCCHCWENHPQVASSPVIQTGPEAHCVHIGLSFSILCLWELTMLLSMVFT